MDCHTLLTILSTGKSQIYVHLILKNFLPTDDKSLYENDDNGQG